jgi:hypothetical protein
MNLLADGMLGVWKVLWLLGVVAGPVRWGVREEVA